MENLVNDNYNKYVGLKCPSFGRPILLSSLSFLIMCSKIFKFSCHKIKIYLLIFYSSFSKRFSTAVPENEISKLYLEKMDYALTPPSMLPNIATEEERPAEN